MPTLPNSMDGTRRAFLRMALGAVPFAFALRMKAADSFPGFDNREFQFVHEFYGSQGYNDPQASANLENQMANGVSLWPPVDSGMTQFVENADVALSLHFAGSVLPGRVPLSYVERQRAALIQLAAANPNRRVVWTLMTEWDQGGGNWVPNGRPRYDGMSRADAYLKLFNYYLVTCQPLGTYVQQPPEERNYMLGAVTDYSPNAIYAYEMGVDLGMLERAIDELGDLSTGIAFLRGAARQFNRMWGIDISTWRTSTNSATDFDSKGNLIGGWSASYLKRHYYVAYMSGAHVIQNEASTYYTRSGQLNPFGQATKEFADFSLRRHTDVGRPSIFCALLVDHYSGFDPKHGPYNQSDAVWYQDIDYSEGDSMIDNFLKVAFPNHWLHGLTPGAPFADSKGRPDTAQFRAYLQRGGDPRPYEPMPFTRWGDNLDVITTKAPLDTLRQYKVIALLGGVTIDSSLRDALRTWVQEGGVLVVNARQMTVADQEWTGVTVQAATSTATAALWKQDSALYSERAFRYSALIPRGASVLATNNGNDALVTSNVYGSGEVIVTAPNYLQTSARDQILNVGVRLFDWLSQRFAVVQVQGIPVEYIVNEAPDRVIVTVVNHSADEWWGLLVTDNARGIAAAREYSTDTTAVYSIVEDKVRITANVPAYDVRVYAFEFQGFTPAA